MPDIALRDNDIEELRDASRRDDSPCRAGVFMIPARDIEAELLTNLRVDDVALVGYPDDDDDGGESPCAVIVPATAPPITLDEVRLHLASRGITARCLPTRLEYVESLPRDRKGKVRTELLRLWLVGRASLLD